MDVVIAVAKTILGRRPGQEFGLMSDGEVLSGTLCRKSTRHLEVVGRVWDLQKAYRQLARKPAHACFTIVASRNSAKGEVELCKQPATSSVQNFSWAARALWHVLVQSLGVTLTHYVGDLPAVVPQVLAGAAKKAVEGVLGLLGWRFKVQPDFLPQIGALGAVFDFATRPGAVLVTNTPGRLDDIQAVATAALRDGRLSRKTQPGQSEGACILRARRRSEGAGRHALSS